LSDEESVKSVTTVRGGGGPVSAEPAEPTEERVPLGHVLIFASPLIGVFLANALLGIYLLKFATDVLYIAPAIVGAIFLAGRVWDAVSDPLVGFLTDRTHTRIGRRRPWFLASAVPVGITIVAVWAPPPNLEGASLVTWFTLSVLLFYTAFTAFRVPHQAMAAELSRGYHDRTRVFAIMQLVESLGLVAGTGCLFLLERATDQRVFAAELLTAVAIFTCALILVTAFSMRERTEYQGRGGRTPWTSLRDVGRNPHARVLIGVGLLEQLGFTALVSVLPYLSDYLLGTPGSTAFYVIGAVGGMVLSIPMWVVASRRFGKKQVWLGSLTVKTGVLGSILFLGEGDFAALIVITLLFGLMHGCSAVVGPSIQADVIDWDEAETGERKEGAYFAVWNFAQKSAGGLAVWLTGSMLSLTGFQPNVEQTEFVVTGIRILAGGFPLVFFGISLFLVARFALDEDAHRALRARLR